NLLRVRPRAPNRPSSDLARLQIGRRGSTFQVLQPARSAALHDQIERPDQNDEEPGRDVAEVLGEPKQHQSVRNNSDDDRAEQCTVDGPTAAGQRHAPNDDRADDAEFKSGAGDGGSDVQVAPNQRRDQPAQAAGQHKADDFDPVYIDAAFAGSIAI